MFILLYIIKTSSYMTQKTSLKFVFANENLFSIFYTLVCVLRAHKFIYKNDYKRM